MRSLAVCVVLAGVSGCGRINFDLTSGVDPTGDGGGTGDSGGTLDGTGDGGASGLYQQGAQTTALSGASITVSLPNPQVAGNLNVVAVTWQGSSTVTSVTDTDGNPYGAPQTPFNSAGLQVQLWYSANIVGGNGQNTVTVSFGISQMTLALRVAEYGGVMQIPFDSSAGQTGNGTSVTTSVGTSNAHDLLILIDSVNRSSSADAPFVQRLAAGDHILADREVFTAGPQSGTITLSSLGLYATQLAAFRLTP